MRKHVAWHTVVLLLPSNSNGGTKILILLVPLGIQGTNGYNPDNHSWQKAPVKDVD